MRELLRDAGECARRVARGEVRAEELVAASIGAIAERDGELGAFLRVDGEGALAEARRWDRAREAGEPLPPLAGVPVAIKDNIATRGLETSCGSRMLAGWRPPFDATVVGRMRRAGAVVVGKTNLDEFGMGSSTENSAFRATRNPWNPARVPGGSSGGSAAAVAAGMVPLALGSDTGGSVRQPASLCGVVGWKPTYGRLSRYGLVAFASSLDTVGLLSARVGDCALLAGLVAGADELDATTAPREVPDYVDELERAPRPLRVGVPREYFGPGIEPDVERLVRETLARLEQEGAELVEISLPLTPHAIAAYYVVATAEASSNLARFDGVRYGWRCPGAGDPVEMTRASRGGAFGAEVKRRIMLGTYALSAGYYEAYYLRAQRVRALVAEEFRRAFARCDLVASPASPTAAFALGERLADPLAMYLSDAHTVAASLAGLPALVIPCGLTGEGLPVGIQLMAAPFAEGLLFRAGRAVERLAGGPLVPPAAGPGGAEA